MIKKLEILKKELKEKIEIKKLMIKREMRTYWIDPILMV